MQYIDTTPREAVAFNEARILRNGAELTFESWSTSVQTKGEYKSGLSGVGLGNNGRSATILCPLPSNDEMAFDTFLRPSEVRTYFPAFGDEIVIQVNRRSYGNPVWVPVFTGTVEKTDYDYSSGMATVTCSDGLDTLLDTPVNVESSMGIKRGNPFDQLLQALSNVGKGNVPPFNWRKTIWTAPAFLTSSAPLYADYGRSSTTGERIQVQEPQHFVYTTDVASYVHNYAQNYGANAKGKALMLTFRGYDVPGSTPYTNWNHRSFIRVHLANGSQIEVGYHGDTKNPDYGYYVWTGHRGIVYTDKYQVFPKPNNVDGYNNPAVSLIYDQGGMTLVVGGQYKVVVSEALPASTDATKVVKVTAKNIIAGDVRLEDNWTEALEVNKNLPKSNIAMELSTEVYKNYSVVLDRLDGIQLGTYVKRACEAGLAGFWIDEGGRPTIMDMARMKKIFEEKATNIALMASDIVGSEAMLSSYSPRVTPAWKAVQVSCHKTQLWYSSESPSTINDYDIPVYQHPQDRPNEWYGEKSTVFIQPKNNKTSWGPVWTDVWTIKADTREPSSGSWIGATLLADKWENEKLYEGVSASIEPLVNSNYKLTMHAPGSRGKKLALRTPQGRTGNGSILVEGYRNLATPVVRAAWMSEKTVAKRTIKKPEWNSTMPVLEMGDEELGLLITEENAPNLANAIMAYADEMKGTMDDYEVHPDARIQVGDPRLVVISDSQGQVKAHIAGTVSGIRLGYSHSEGLRQTLSLVLRYEKEFYA